LVDQSHDARPRHASDEIAGMDHPGTPATDDTNTKLFHDPSCTKSFQMLSFSFTARSLGLTGRAVNDIFQS
jgi:hypothetical protein